MNRHSASFFKALMLDRARALEDCFTNLILRDTVRSMLEEASFLSGRHPSVALIITPATLFQKRKEKRERKDK